MAFLAITVIVAYTLLILAFTLGYYRILEQKPIPASQRRFISIVICFRDEAENIPSLMECIRNLDYPTDMYEVVAVNDHSTDSTAKLLVQYKKQQSNLRIINLSEGVYGKKNALIAGVNAAKADFIACTDADCLLPTSWLSWINCYFTSNTSLICGPVAYQPTSIFSKIAAVEFGSLVASGIGSAGVHTPIFCNGANLAFTKDTFAKASLRHDTPSGDDVFLLHSAKQHNLKITFATGNEILVQTAPDKSISDFLNRRKRWGSKAKYYTDLPTKAVAMLVLLANLTILALLLAAILSSNNVQLLVSLFGLKSAADFFLLWVHFKSNGIKGWWFYFWLAAFVYPAYMTFAILGSFTSKFTWKERKYQQ